MSAHKILNPADSWRVSAGLCALGIMTKVPEPGKVKTRLAPPLMAEEAARLNICFLRDVACSITRAATTAPGHGVGVYTPAGQETAYVDILPNDFFLVPQRGEGFGERLLFALEDLLAVGFESVCLINSDSPTVPALSFVEAAKELANPGDRMVIGPSDDGGYYLIGLKKLHRRLFEDIAWSTEQVFDQTLERAAEIGIPVHQLSRGFDVDDRATLRRLCDELLGKTTGSTIEAASHTRAFLSEIIEREGRDRIWPV